MRRNAAIGPAPGFKPQIYEFFPNPPNPPCAPLHRLECQVCQESFTTFEAYAENRIRSNDWLFIGSGSGNLS